MSMMVGSNTTNEYDMMVDDGRATALPGMYAVSYTQALVCVHNICFSRYLKVADLLQ